MILTADLHLKPESASAVFDGSVHGVGVHTMNARPSSSFSHGARK